MAGKVRDKFASKALALAGLAGILMIGGCNNGAKFPDSVDAVNTALTQNNLGNIHVSEDRYKGIITLTGAVATQDQKTQAQSVALEAGATYTIQNEITVVPPQ